MNMQFEAKDIDKIRQIVREVLIESTGSNPQATEGLGLYAGKLVFVEASGTGSDGKPVSTYYNGEYFIVRSTPGVLYACKLSPGYGGHELKQLSIVGSTPYKVIDSYPVTSGMANSYIEGMERFIEEGRCGKKQWVDSVYSGAAENLRHVKKALGRSY